MCMPFIVVNATVSVQFAILKEYFPILLVFLMVETLVSSRLSEAGLNDHKSSVRVLNYISCITLTPFQQGQHDKI